MEDFSNFKEPVPLMYESLLRVAYHCGRGNDPFKLANTDMCYRDSNDHFEPYCLAGVWTALCLLESQIDSPEDSSKIKKIRDNFEVHPTYTYFKRIYKELFKILDRNHIREFPHWESLPYNI